MSIEINDVLEAEGGATKKRKPKDDDAAAEATATEPKATPPAAAPAKTAAGGAAAPPPSPPGGAAEPTARKGGGKAVPSAKPGEPASPEEQQAVDQVATAAVIELNQQPQSDTWVKMLRDNANRAEYILAKLTVDLFHKLDEVSKHTIPEAIVLESARQILLQVGELAQVSNAFPVDEGMLNRAMHAVLEKLAPEYGVTEDQIAGVLANYSDEELQQAAALQQSYEAQMQKQGGPSATEPAQDPNAPPAPPVGGIVSAQQPPAEAVPA